jgi:two-component system sensor histidine kinase TctE
VWRSELEGIAQAEQRASRTVDQLLALARAAEGDIALSLQPLSLDALVRDVVLRWLARADALGVDLGAQGLDSPVQVRGHAGLIEGLLNNLLDNALRYGRGEPAQITVSLRQEGDFAVLQVADNGPGMDAALTTHVQQRWAQGAPGLTLGQGAGLGLSIVARYVQLLDGRLAMGSATPGPGLEVTVSLPLAASASVQGSLERPQ